MTSAEKLAKKREHYHANRELIRARERGYQISFRNRQYGMTDDQFFELYTFQNKRCGICKLVLPDPSVAKGREICRDHDHLTHRMRGLLCFRCNIVSGLWDKGWRVDSPSIQEYMDAPPANSVNGIGLVTDYIKKRPGFNDKRKNP